MIIRSPQNANFVMIPNSFANCAQLSWGARGIGLYLLSKPANWKVMIADLVHAGNAGKDGVYTLLDELMDAGYLHRKGNRTEKGTFESYDYVMYDFPFASNKSSPQPDLPEAAEPEAAEPPLQKQKDTKTEEDKKQSTPAEQSSFFEEISSLDAVGKDGSMNAEKRKRITVPHTSKRYPAHPMPTNDLIALWKKHFPAKPQPMAVRGTRQKLLSARWQDGFKREYYSDAETGLQWWDQFLGWCAKSPIIVSKSFFNFDFLIKPDSFDKVIEGNYRE